MTRLIDADDLHEILNWTMFKPPFSKKQVRRFIDDSRTVDAVPVIRCKDCKYYTGKWCKKDSTKQLDLNDRITNDGDFCSWAERKEE